MSSAKLSQPMLKNESNDIAVLLVNLGTPTAPTTSALRQYLREFLSDPRVIEAPRILWWIILRVFILPFRSGKSAKAYEAIWDTTNDESPLRGGTRRLSEKLALNLEGLRIDWAMRYGHPSIEERVTYLVQKGYERIVVWPLYPQYSASTTASVIDSLGKCLTRLRKQPAIRVVPPYFNKSAYINALKRSIEDSLDALTWEPERLLLSFHGLPVSYIERGDPYLDHCLRTADALKTNLNLPDSKFEFSFQSRFGPSQWLQPFTDTRLKELPSEGIKKIAVLCPGFAVDCIETLEEIGIRGRQTFLASGGSHFALLRCLNDGPAAVEMAQSLLEPELAGWVGK